ncbi:MAG: JAB domain-containing protein [Chitinophagaceae bacterium]|nr:MAG: JAB domain-containing protein [Chitinophagaceae bacterium]
MDNFFSGHSIKSWAEDDRPREKLMKLGRKNLSDAELLAILLRSGSRKSSALELSKKILSDVDNDLDKLAKISIDQIVNKYHGVGEAKAITLIAALELGIRRNAKQSLPRSKITSSKDVFDLLQAKFIDLPHEEFWVMYLNRSNIVIKSERISLGGSTGTVADPKIILKRAVELIANAIILAHNHPSGSLKPSQADISLTKKIKEAASYLDVYLFDHLIFTDKAYFSFADEGYI